MPCALFNGVSGVAVKGRLVTSPFRMWQKKSEKLKAYENSAYHYESMVLADDLKWKNEHPEEAITAVADKTKAANIARNQNILKSVTQAVLYCGQQCIALRGDAEKLDTLGNRGNFLALLKLIAVHDLDLRTNLESPQMHRVTYMSGHTQNEVIEVLRKYILRGIVEEIKKAPFYTILADEVTLHNVEHLAICARFVENSDIREEFLAFINLDRIPGEKIARDINKLLEENYIPVANMRGQGNDGASNMSYDYVGVQRRICEVNQLCMCIAAETASTSSLQSHVPCLLSAA